ncbi:glutamate-5-semialdehyde dehydrogenase [Vallitalea okinawensis]|uniref:glutamate-5-semialdehyde dehydrogenase n=1 Tax=Vallitalea okinawensis TaxID=2078660 RepID=UPI000CFB9C81|nr:glutamate-5-semialdehyde dehydrogenase [Vallitalea okinawensis]
MKELLLKGRLAKEISSQIGYLSTDLKNKVLMEAGNLLELYYKEILEENSKDVALAKEKGIKSSLIDRLQLSEERIKSIAEGLRKIIRLDDPVNEVIWMKKRPNGLRIGQKRVPIGVIGMIYESRPNVTVDTFGLCFKTGNAILLRGGSDAINSNKALVRLLQLALTNNGLPKEAVQLLEDTSRETALEMMKMNDYLDLLIPRGGAGLIQTVIQNSTVPVIETGVGNCHIFVDESADISNALDIIMNAKTQRPGVCNACESVVIHKNIAKEFITVLYESIKEQVECRGDEQARAIVKELIPATEEDWGMEYLDYILSIKVVDGIDEAIHHINLYNTKHSESIITENYTNAERFLEEIDAAAVYVNASTRFTDGEMFGFGAEIGISTQKLHARGPMGLKELTSTKYIIYGNGQIRN